MSTDADFIHYVCDQAKTTVRVSARKMFGEYALYVNGKVVALACDNSLYLKPTEAARALLSEVHERQPFPGAKMWWVIDDELDNQERLGELLAATERALPVPRTPKKRKPRSSPEKTP